MKVTESNFQSLAQEGLVLVDFYADWCGPCRALAPVLEKLTGVTVLKVNVDEEQGLAMQFQVSSIPKLVLLKDGVVVSEAVGLRSQASLQEMIDQAAE